MAVLVVLAESNGKPVHKNDILDAVWPGQVVADGVVTRAVYELRQIFRSDPDTPDIIETLPRLGYRLTVPAVPLSDEVRNPPTTTVIPERTAKKLLIALTLIVAAAVLAAGLFAIRSPAGPRSIAVLPLTNFTGDAERDYLGEGLAEQIIHLLARQPELSVVSRTSSFALADRELTIQQIAAELKVDTVIEGSIRAERGVQRVTIQLTGSRSGAPSDSLVIDVLDDQLFMAQEKIAGQVLEMILPGREVALPATAVDSTTIELVMKGRAALHGRNRQSLSYARELFQQALALQPDYADAYAGLAQVELVLPVYAGTDKAAGTRAARRAADAALSLNPDQVDALAVSAALAFERREYANAVEQFQRAIRLAPSNAQAHQWFGGALRTLGYIDQALAATRRAVELNPLAGGANTSYAQTLLLAGELEAARTPTLRADRFGAGFAPRILALIHFRHDRLTAFEEELAKHYQLAGAPVAVARGFAAYLRGETSAGELIEIVEDVSAPQSAGVGFFFREWSLAGFPRNALAALTRQSDDLQFFSEVWLAEAAQVRALPEFSSLLRELGLMDYWSWAGSPAVCRGEKPEPFCLELASAQPAQ